MTPLLATEKLEASYGDFQALFGIDVTLDAGETVAVVGANGAGKSTFLRTITGLLPASAGAIQFDGEQIGGKPASEIARMGIALVPEGRRLFPSLSVEENLLMGACVDRAGNWTLDTVYKLFPVLQERRHTPSTALSGGQQQMVAIGRALMANPKILLCDELSLGLAPIIIKDIYDALPAIKDQGTSLIIVEQDIQQAMRTSSHVYCFQEGRVSLSGPPADLTRQQITQAYFGI